MFYNAAASKYRIEHSVSPSILQFHRNLPNYAQTPLVSLPASLCSDLGLKHVFLKDESLRFGLPAFKVLGASWASFKALTQLFALPHTSTLRDVRCTAAGRGITLYAATDGNFGRAVAMMATLLGVAAKIYIPSMIVEGTRAWIREEGAEVVVIDGNYDATVRFAAQSATQYEGALLVQDDAWPGYEEIPAWVVEGYSTMMAEIDEQTISNEPNLIVCPVGVGSLAQATVSHFKAQSRKDIRARVLTVEPETAACLKTSLENGESTVIETGHTNMCGMNCGTLSSLAWPILKEGVDASVTVSDAEANQAMRLLEDLDVSTGPCSAGTLAALLKIRKSSELASMLGLGKESTVVLLGTEGPR